MQEGQGQAAEAVGEAPALSRGVQTRGRFSGHAPPSREPLSGSRVCRLQCWVPSSYWRVPCAPVTTGSTGERVLLWGFPRCQAQVGMTFGTPAVGERHSAVVGTLGSSALPGVRSSAPLWAHKQPLLCREKRLRPPWKLPWAAGGLGRLRRAAEVGCAVTEPLSDSVPGAKH